MTDLKKLRKLAQIAVENGTMFLIDTQAIIELLDRLERYEKALEIIRDNKSADGDGDVAIAREALEGGK